MMKQYHFTKETGNWKILNNLHRAWKLGLKASSITSLKLPDLLTWTMRTFSYLLTTALHNPM